MLQRSFVHLPGIGAAREKKLIAHGILDWHALADIAPSFFRGGRLGELQQGLAASHEAWERKDAFYFYNNLPRTELWRLIPDFLDETAFLDIETNGLELPPGSRSTTITFYFRGQVYQEYDYGPKEKLLKKMSDEASVFCTYFGEVFDVPFLRREFSLPLQVAQLDLCFWLRRLGYHGGLKKVEKRFEQIPARRSYDIDGFDAVRLWTWHEKGMSGALDTLLTYNAEDTIILEALMVAGFNLELERRPHLGLTSMPVPTVPPLTTKVDEAIYRSLRRPGSESDARRASAIW